MTIIDTCAARLREIADKARRLPPPNRRNPEAFHEGRDELAREIHDVAQILAGKIQIGQLPKAPIREGNVISRGKVIRVEFRNKKRP